MKRVKPFYKDHWLDSLDKYIGDYDFWHDGILEELEGEIVKRYMRMYALTVNSASNAIFMALYIWSKIHPGRNEVIIPNWGYPAAFKACLVLGLEPVPVDIDESTLGMNMNQMYECMNTRTLAIIHIENNGIMGHVAEMYAMIKSNDKDILFIEDSAPSMLQEDAGRFGDVSIFSFGPTKPLMAGEGAVMMMDDEMIYNNLKQLRHTPNYEDKSPSLNFMLSPFLAAFILPQLHYLDYLTKMRDMVHLHYSHRLNIFSEHTNRHGAIMYLSDKADKISKTLTRFNVQHRYKYYPCFIDDETEFPVSCKVRRTIVDLPIHHKINEDQIAMVCNLVIKAEGE